jgi:hypothetical protein
MCDRSRSLPITLEAAGHGSAEQRTLTGRVVMRPLAMPTRASGRQTATVLNQTPSQPVVRGMKTPTRLPTWFWRALPRCAAILAAALTGCGSSVPSAVSIAGPAAAHTQRVYVSPVTSAGAPVEGYRVTSRASDGSCEPGSEAIGEGYRCSAGNYLYDPCWAEKAATPTVLCLAEPWLRTVAEIRLNSAVPALAREDGGSVEPWGLRLADGNRCLLAQGAHTAFDGTVLDYYCGSGLALLRGLNRTRTTWTARAVVDRRGKLSRGPTEKIKIAWYGSPERFR